MSKSEMFGNTRYEISARQSGFGLVISVKGWPETPRTKRERVRDFFRDLLPKGVWFDVVAIS